jgi:hypothetical protein
MRRWVASALVMASSGWAIAACGDAQTAGRNTAAQPAAGQVCGYATAVPGSIPAEAAKVLPGHVALLSSEAQADGGSHAVVLTDIPFKQSFSAILARAEGAGWTTSRREREVRDAEIELTRGSEELSLALSLSNIPGCTGTSVDVVFSPQG